jgi:heme A synthase
MMAVNEELVSFVREALAHKVSRVEIEQALQRGGWTKEQTRAALDAFVDADFPLPVPRARPYLSAREAFQYLVLFATLYTSAFCLGSLVFDFINLAFPDLSWAADGYAYDVYAREGIRWSVSALIVAFPVFLYTSWLTSVAIGRDPMKRASKIRRWLTYLTLFVAAVVLIGDITTLVYNLLGGELTVRFALKVVTVALIAGTAFTYYLRDLRFEEQESRA